MKIMGSDSEKDGYLKNYPDPTDPSTDDRTIVRRLNPTLWQLEDAKDEGSTDLVVVEPTVIVLDTPAEPPPAEQLPPSQGPKEGPSAVKIIATVAGIGFLLMLMRDMYSGSLTFENYFWYFIGTLIGIGVIKVRNIKINISAE